MKLVPRSSSSSSGHLVRRPAPLPSVQASQLILCSVDDNRVLAAGRWEVTRGGHGLLWDCLQSLAGGFLFTQQGGCQGWWMPCFTLPLTSTILTCRESSKGTILILPIPQLTPLSSAKRVAALVRVALGRVRAFLCRT